MFEPTCLAIGGRQHIMPGRIYVGFGDHVEVFSPDGAKEAIWQGIDKARFSSISTSDHDVYIADAGWNVVQHFDTTGKLLSPIGESSPGHFAPAPDGPAHNFDLVVGRDDLVYVVNRRDCRIRRLRLRWRNRAALGSGLACLRGFRRTQQSDADRDDGRGVS